MNGFTNQEYSGWLDALEADTRIIYPVDTHRMDDIPAEWVERIKKEGVLWKN